MEWKEKVFDLLLGGIGLVVGRYFTRKWKVFQERISYYLSLKKKVDMIEAHLSKFDDDSVIFRNKLMGVIETAIDPMTIAKKDGALIYANPAWFKYSGFQNEDDAYGFGYREAIPERDRSRIENVSKNLSQHGNTWAGEVTLKHIVSGEETRFWCRIIPIENSKGEQVKRLARLTLITK